MSVCVCVSKRALCQNSNDEHQNLFEQRKCVKRTHTRIWTCMVVPYDTANNNNNNKIEWKVNLNDFVNENE